VFGGRIDADSWRLAFGDDELDPSCPPRHLPAPPPLQVSSSADVGAVPPVGTPRTVVLHDSFDTDSPVFATGAQTLSTGTLTTTARNGHFRMEVSGVGAGYTAWTTAAVTGVGDNWAVSATPGKTRGSCGVIASDGATQLVVTVDREAATGLIGWFNRVGSTHNEPFPIPAGATGDLTLVGDHGVLAVLMGGRRVATVSDSGFRPPTSAGLATYGDSASCDSDEFTVTTAP
jgi:hypothetical protein